MANILHVCNSFDPAADVVRVVAELKKYSKHQHEVLIYDRHPLQHIYHYPEIRDLIFIRYAEQDLWPWADAVLYHFVGWERGYGILKKPCAFRNINIYYNKTSGLFWSEPQYNAGDLSEYALLASSHIGAADFLPGCRWLPDLIPIHDKEYLPDFSERPPCISYIKHNKSLDMVPFDGVNRLKLNNTAHATVLERRQKEATVVIDNVCDGHFGMAGLESMSLGLTTICFNHDKTREALLGLSKAYPPFVEVNSLDEAAYQAITIAKKPQISRMLSAASRNWMELYYHPKRIIELFWEPFFKDMLK